MTCICWPRVLLQQPTPKVDLLRRSRTRQEKGFHVAAQIVSSRRGIAATNAVLVLRGRRLWEGSCGERLLADGFSTGRTRLSCGLASMDPQLGYDLLMSIVTLSGALGSLKVFDELAKRDVFDKKLSRKLVHICVGLIFMLFWPLFSNAPRARYLAAMAPGTNALRMIGLGTGLWENKALVKAVSREGHQRELLKGPLYYAITITLVTLLFWRDSPLSAVTIANLCAGDGFADIIGRKYGTTKLPYNPRKSYIGSLAMFVTSAAISILYAGLFSHLGYYSFTAGTFFGIVAVSFASTLIESLPISTKLDDNLTVPCTAVLVGIFTL